jgi:cytochrome bd ubiquinol oxidase subunit I
MRAPNRTMVLYKAIPMLSFLFTIGFLLWAEPGFAQEAASGSVDYRDIPYIGSRNLIWIVAQLHLLFAGFVLGVPIFAWLCEYIGVRTGDLRYDRLAKEFTKLLTASYATTALLGGILLFLLIGLYPKFFTLMSDIFYPTYLVYGILFLLETPTLYLYWYGWDAMAKRKGLHLFLGLLLNIFGFIIMIVANSWATFQASPVVLTEGMGAFERAWIAVQNPTWWPVNIHRFIANVVLGGFICGAYAGIRYLGAKSREEREHYDWMGYIGNFIGIFGLLPLPFAGYWLMREVYEYNQQMGITLMGGFLSWLFILQAILIGVLFLGANFYFWTGLVNRIEGGIKYRKYMLIMLSILMGCLAIWMTPHSLVASLEEARKLGGTHHRLLSVFGVMSAKMTVVNIMILVTIVKWSRFANVFQVGLFASAVLAVIALGIWGYFVPAIVRINQFSTSQVLIVLFVLLTVTPLTGALLRSAKMTTKMVWGQMPARAQYALVLNAVIVILTMTLMGYARSASRVHWHIYGVMADKSPYAYSPALGHAGAFMSLCTFIFCLMVAFIFWVASMAGQKEEAVELTAVQEGVAAGFKKPV